MSKSHLQALASQTSPKLSWTLTLLAINCRITLSILSSQKKKYGWISPYSHQTRHAFARRFGTDEGSQVPLVVAVDINLRYLLFPCLLYPQSLRSSYCFPTFKITMAQTDVPEALAKIDRRSKDVPWYSSDMGNKLGDSARELLEKYSKIPADEVESHVYAVVRYYPSITSYHRHRHR